MDYKIEVVTLAVSDVDQALEFYTAKAGFALDVDYHPAEAARSELSGCGVKVSDIRRKAPAGDWKGRWAPGPDTRRGDYASFADFADPDGNTWVLQEIGHHPG